MLGATVLALVPLLAIACSSTSSPSALDISERQAEYQALFEDFDDQWFLEGKTGSAAQTEHGFVIPDACKQTVAEAQSREEVLDNALLLASVDDNRQEIYDLWGKKIDLLKELDSDLKQDCS